MKKLIECVPNFSEGNNMDIINELTSIITLANGVKLLDVDPGKATNRTVMTFVGNPDDVVETAFQLIKKAKELIDMSQHHGAHPRFGATDVCPLIPIANIDMSEVIALSHKLAARVGDELGIPVYCYEQSASTNKRTNLATCRSGEYEGLQAKMALSEWEPDFGPNQWNPTIAKSGAIAIGARNILVAYNINLNTISVRRANSVAFDLRELGRIKREGDSLTGKIIKNSLGEPIYEPGLLKSVKAIGWFIKEHDIAQISMNLTKLDTTPLHIAFDKACEKASERGLRVTGSELIGVVPLKTMLDAGRYFLAKQKRSMGISDNELIRIAVKSMGLDELYPFDPSKKIIEYSINDVTANSLIQLPLESFAQLTSSEAPAPGGGSVAAYLGVLGVSLAAMVANLSAQKRGWESKLEYFSHQAMLGMEIQKKLLKLVDDDTNAFSMIMSAYEMPKSTEKEKELRHISITNALLNAIKVPIEVMENAYASMEILNEMAQNGNSNSISDTGVGAICALSAIKGAYLNVKINAKTLDDKSLSEELINRANKTYEKALKKESEIINIVEKHIGK